MSLREELIDAVIDGKIGNGIVVTRKQVMNFFSGKYEENFTGCVLSNSEIKTSDHSPTYKKFTIRMETGVYRIHPIVILERMKERKIL